ncbi:MAG TPA: amidase [Burkholderiaceae bacterium]|nr:amidase [Burkholderiaceae bacterium]
MVDGSEVHYLEIGEVARLLRTRQLGAVELTQSMLRRIEQLDPRLKSYALVTADLALAQAREADRLLGRRQILSQLHGVPIAVKDLCFTEGVATAAGMPIHRDFVPRFDATVVRRLREAGAVLLGKLQLTEGAFADHHPSIAPPVNPWHADHWSGASSSGSGVATAAGLCFGSLGSDTGGSIRFPSAANGNTGLKPTWGRVSRHGCFELAASLDHIGPICRSAGDAAIVLGAIAGADPDDPTTLRAPVPDYEGGDERDLRGFRVGFDEGYALSGVEPEVQRAVDEALRTVRSLGAQIVPVRFPSVDAAVADWGPHCAVETAVAHESTFPSRRQEYGPGLAGLIDAGRALSGLEYQRIALRRRVFTGLVHRALEPVDALLVPAQPFAAPTVERMATLGQVPAELAALIRYTAPFDLSGHPTLTVPAAFTAKGLPVAVQFVGKHLGEAEICRAGRAFQRVTDWHRRHPRL